MAGCKEQKTIHYSTLNYTTPNITRMPTHTRHSDTSQIDTVCFWVTQVTEKTDSCLDNLRMGLELWDKQLMLGGEVDGWAGAKLALFAESHPFQNEQEVLTMRVRHKTIPITNNHPILSPLKYLSGSVMLV